MPEDCTWILLGEAAALVLAKVEVRLTTGRFESDLDARRAFEDCRKLRAIRSDYLDWLRTVVWVKANDFDWND
ncbi:unnamed protein product [marine sediment metagenome]|uniref:Uncharacterized protein n=1 Tax=marine sediment metagenome TaxID=412755 RepID=X0WJU0_9ZZZZ